MNKYTACFLVAAALLNAQAGLADDVSPDATATLGDVPPNVPADPDASQAVPATGLSPESSTNDAVGGMPTDPTTAAPITPPDAPNVPAAPAVETMSDTDTVSAVMSKLARDPVLSSYKLQVYANGPTVTLTGNVMSDADYQHALMLAYTVNGVQNVDATGLTVTNGTKYVKDLDMIAHIQANIFNKNIYTSIDPSTWPIQIDSTNNAIVVTGTASSDLEKASIIDTINATPGIAGLQSNIEVLAPVGTPAMPSTSEGEGSVNPTEPVAPVDSMPVSPTDMGSGTSATSTQSSFKSSWLMQDQVEKVAHNHTMQVSFMLLADNGYDYSYEAQENSRMDQQSMKPSDSNAGSQDNGSVVQGGEYHPNSNNMSASEQVPEEDGKMQAGM